MSYFGQNILEVTILGGVNMTNRNDNRERKNKYPNNKKQDTEFGIDINFPNEIAKRNLQNKPK